MELANRLQLVVVKVQAVHATVRWQVDVRREPEPCAGIQHHYGLRAEPRCIQLSTGIETSPVAGKTIHGALQTPADGRERVSIQPRHAVGLHAVGKRERSAGDECAVVDRNANTSLFMPMPMGLQRRAVPSRDAGGLTVRFP